MRAKMKPEEKVIYQIVLEGDVDSSWSDWFHGFEIQSSVRGDEQRFTALSGPVVDQAELRGILNKLWDLNMELVSVSRIKENYVWNIVSHLHEQP